MPKQLREPVNGLMHLGAAIAAAIGAAVMLFIGREDVSKLVSLSVYGSSLVLMFSASATYHLVNAKTEVEKFLRKLDHSSIYLLIAGTYTPLCLTFFDGFWRWGLLAIIWGMAVIGIGVKLFVINAPRWVTAGIYMLMGWLSMSAINEMLATMPLAVLVLMLAGGIWFSVGAIIYVAKRPNFFPGVFGFHELWHVFVILGCASHFIAIAVFVAPHAV
jgi:hemolysin III